jgi:hypothetical protein
MSLRNPTNVVKSRLKYCQQCTNNDKERVCRESVLGNKMSHSQRDPFTESRSERGEFKSGHQMVIVHKVVPDIRLRARDSII